MDNSLKSKNQILWINSIKLISCVVVILYHINIGFIEYNLGISHTKLSLDLSGYVNSLINGDRCVCLFCFASGLFAVKKKVPTLKVFVVESISRYLYFVINMLIVGAFVLLFSKFGLFRSKDALVLFGEDSYFARIYDETLTFHDYILSAFIFDTSCNPPIWMLPMILLGNIYIYFIIFISSKFNIKWLKIVLLGISLYLCFHFNKLYLGSCILGSILSPLICCEFNKSIKTICIFGISLLYLYAFFSNYLDPLFHIISNFYSMDYETLRNFFVAPIIFILVNHSVLIKKALEIKPFASLANLSFPAYIIHWPVLESFSVTVYVLLSKVCSYTLSFLSTTAISLIAIFALAYIYDSLFGKYIKKIITSVKKYYYNNNKRYYFSHYY